MAQKKKAKKSGKSRIGRVFSLLMYYSIVTGFFVIAGILTLNRVVMPELVKKGIELEVPELVGLEYAEAVRKVRDSDFRSRMGGHEPHPEFASGVVMSQDPGSGELQRAGDDNRSFAHLC